MRLVPRGINRLLLVLPLLTLAAVVGTAYPVIGRAWRRGVAIVQGQIAAARTGEPGFSHLRFPKPGYPEPVLKAAYTVLTKGWG